MKSATRSAMVLRNDKTGEILARNIYRAETLRERTRGLIGRNASDLGSDDGVWIDDCFIVHTLGMSAPIDVFFLDRQGKILKIARRVEPNTIGIACAKAHTTLEIGCAGELGYDVLIGDVLTLSPE